MDRRDLIGLIGGVAAWASFAARAQSGKPLLRIGVMHSGRDGDPQALEDVAAFRAGLEALGWKEGRDVQFDFRFTAGDPGRPRELAAQLVSLAPAVIMSGGTVNLAALSEATKTIPIVFVNVADPVAGGFVASLARPGGNITGITPLEYEIGGKWLQLLKEMAPDIKRVALLGDPANPNFKGFQKSFETYAKSISVESIAVPIRDADDLDRAIRSLASESNGGLIVSAGSYSVIHRDLIVAMADKYKLPAIYWNRGQVVRGGLMSYGPDILDTFRQASAFVDRILKGVKPDELAVQTPVKIQLIVNGATAKALGLPIPLSILSSADEVIE